MFKRILPIVLTSFFFVIIVNWGCTKLDTTNLGADLIPAVDNINTFADTLDINTTQGIFDDSFKIFRDENHVLGIINNDPIFGSTEANIFLQPKPGFFPYYLGSAGDTLVGLDSVVLCLNYVGAWGDTILPQQLSVYEFNDTNFGDSVFKSKTIKYQPPTLGAMVGSKTVDIRRLKDSIWIANRKDSVNSQIRIKLSSAYANTLFGRDSMKVSPSGNNAFYTDSLYRKLYSGLAVKATGASGNALMYISLTDPKTRIEVHIRRKLAGTGKLDTTYSSLKIAVSEFAATLPSGTANYIKRTHPGNITNPSASELFLQSGPGTYANLKIPGLSTLNNRIVHRAFIAIEQIPENVYLDSIFSVPPQMYLDLIDTGITARWKPLYFDLNPNTTYDPDFKTGFPYFPANGEIDYGYFGGYARKKTNAVGQSVYYYDLNVTRYVQQLVTKGTPNYDMRLFPGFRTVYPQYGTADFPANSIALDNPLAYGRIKIKSGSHPDKRVKMRLIIIYSKI